MNRPERRRTTTKTRRREGDGQKRCCPLSITGAGFSYSRSEGGRSSTALVAYDCEAACDMIPLAVRVAWGWTACVCLLILPTWQYPRMNWHPRAAARPLSLSPSLSVSLSLYLHALAGQRKQCECPPGSPHTTLRHFPSWASWHGPLSPSPSLPLPLRNAFLIEWRELLFIR